MHCSSQMFQCNLREIRVNLYLDNSPCLEAVHLVLYKSFLFMDPLSQREIIILCYLKDFEVMAVLRVFFFLLCLLPL